LQIRFKLKNPPGSITLTILTDEFSYYKIFLYRKGVSMKGRCAVFVTVIAALLMYPVAGMAAGTVTFEPVRAPSMGPDTAPVTIIEIADYM
jgi:hypothetical protein